MSDLRVELLVTEGCPHADRARHDLETVLRASIIETPIQLVIVGSAEDAEFLGFPGSPTIRVDGEDVDPHPGLAAGLSCRVYRTSDGTLVGSPPIERIRERIEAHRRGRLTAFQRNEAGLVAAFAADAAAAEGNAAAQDAAAEHAPAADDASEADTPPDRGASLSGPDR